MVFGKADGVKNSIYTHEQQTNHKRHLDFLRQEFTNRLANPPKYAKSIEEFDKILTLGQGAFGTVLLTRDTVSLKYHAMKVIQKAEVLKKDKCLKQLYREKEILQSTDFPFLTTLDFVLKDNLYVYLVFPYEAGGEMFTLLKRLVIFSEKLAVFYAAQVVLALEYLHNCSVIHRDVKPENILINASGYIKLADFGLSRILKSRTWTLCGTPEFIAPEIILSKGYTFSVDWWSLGVLIYEMIAGCPPFYHTEPLKLYEKVLEGNFGTPPSMSSICKSLVKGLLQVNPLKRLGSIRTGVFDIKAHAWFRKTVWDSIYNQMEQPPYIPTCANPGDANNFTKQDDAKLQKSPICLYESEFKDF